MELILREVQEQIGGNFEAETTLIVFDCDNYFDFPIGYINNKIPGRVLKKVLLTKFNFGEIF